MDLTIDDDLDLRTRSGELLSVHIRGLTCNVEVEAGRVIVDRVWIDGRPWPQRGGEIDPLRDGACVSNHHGDPVGLGGFHQAQMVGRPRRAPLGRAA